VKQSNYLLNGSQLPKKNLFIVGLMATKFLLIIPLVKLLIKSHLKHCKNIDFIPGFFYYYGNIYAEQVDFGNAFLMDYAPIYVGEGTYFGWESTILTAHHEPTSFDTIHAQSVHIGKNVMIYSRAMILGGVSIGDNTIIGAGSVVTRNIPSNVFAAGNPARVIKKLKKKPL
jgi:acetyltransferase-like isoleucine patch superfamily enzyme